jgi:hypothetical protein
MANTKNLTLEDRKQAKRDSRRAVKARYGELTLAQRKALRKYEGTQSDFLRELDAKTEG